MIPLLLMQAYSRTKTVLSRSDILEVGVPLELWVMGH